MSSWWWLLLGRGTTQDMMMNCLGDHPEILSKKKLMDSPTKQHSLIQMDGFVNWWFPIGGFCFIHSNYVSFAPIFGGKIPKFKSWNHLLSLNSVPMLFGEGCTLPHASGHRCFPRCSIACSDLHSYLVYLWICHLPFWRVLVGRSWVSMKLS